MTLERAIAIAAEAHAGQTDKVGDPYILHPVRVMLAVRAPEQRVAAVLHDVLEKTAWTHDALRAEGFSDEVIAAVDALTRREGEDYFDFVRRAAAHPVARPIKIADTRDNIETSRTADPGGRDQARIDRYREALRILAEWPQP